jgi:hypothetical protein
MRLRAQDVRRAGAALQSERDSAVARAVDGRSCMKPGVPLPAQGATLNKPLASITVDRGCATTIARELLRQQHEGLELLYAQVLSAYREGDWEDVEAYKNVFEASLRRWFDALGINVELHATPFQDVEELVRHLRTHDEERSFVESV